MNAIMEATNLTVAFPGTVAVQGVTLSIQAGETLALVGESGSGKSATALALMRLLPASARILSGRVRFEGTDLMGQPAAALRRLRGKRISMIFQEPMTSLNPVMSIGGQIAEVLRQHESLSRKQARDRAVDLLALVRIPDPARRYDEFPHNLSGGMRQRVMIAMAVACNPRLLIADEPTTALDVTIQAQILELLDGLRRQLSMAVLLITHDLGVVAQWADRVAVMYAGRIVEQTTAARLFQGGGPAHPYTRGLLVSTIALDAGKHYRHARLHEIPGTIADAAGAPGCAFAPRCPGAHSDCLHRPPPLEEVGPGHLAACFAPLSNGRLSSSHGDDDALALG
ncbi:ABC transporter ATP-binding protein [Telmatospirillum siberiense]|uniref:Dipeptide ABC transporter ATP-binding protein DppD n=1 Tax=Telmatospirillum siberiense TaxID=382514 RepID=A0A2N3PP13_9PROT|nr:ABC transporter ATP-binding protein [Telmatospirillum siberiense]PKU22159.1 dipeptide ABC transporter ATP-binding protein DppD [Telmatospirillum siberiense]